MWPWTRWVLVALDAESGVFVDEQTGGSITLPDIPGFELTVAPGSATFPDGSRQGVVSVTAVNSDKVPMVPNFGQQPTVVLTIQPSGVHFDPPAALTLPNLDGLAPRITILPLDRFNLVGYFIVWGIGNYSRKSRKDFSNGLKGIHYR